MTTTPPIVTKLVALAVAIAGPVLALTDPSGKLSTGAVQAAVLLGGIFAGAIIYLVDEINKNGLSKAGITKTISDEEAWVRAHAAELKSTFEAAKPALDTIPGVPDALAAVTADVATLKAAVPTPDADAIKAAVKDLVLPGVLKENVQAPAAPAVPPATTVQTVTPAAPAVLNVAAPDPAAPVAADPAAAGQTA